MSQEVGMHSSPCGHAHPGSRTRMRHACQRLLLGLNAFDLPNNSCKTCLLSMQHGRKAPVRLDPQRAQGRRALTVCG
eukprot:806322-Pyramimonas_sp.AAC.1